MSEGNSAGVDRPECHGTDVEAGGQLFGLVLTVHHGGSKDGDKHHYPLCYFGSPETRSVMKPGVHSLPLLPDK